MEAEEATRESKTSLRAQRKASVDGARSACCWTGQAQRRQAGTHRPGQLPGVSTLSTGSTSHDAGFRQSVTRGRGLQAWPGCLEENGPSGQGWGPESLRRPQQSSWEKSSVDYGGGPWARSLDSGPEGVGLGGSGGWCGWAPWSGQEEGTSGKFCRVEGEWPRVRREGSSEAMAGRRQWSSEPHPVQGWGGWGLRKGVKLLPSPHLHTQSPANLPWVPLHAG